jgi:lambda repressor-like predicted transcriptional regulator
MLREKIEMRAERESARIMALLRRYVKLHLARRGLTMRAWALQHDISVARLSMVLSSKSATMRSLCIIAVMLREDVTSMLARAASLETKN